MPLYDYRCTKCKSKFLVRKRMSEVGNPTYCPECNSLNTEKLISTVAVFSSSGGKRRALAGGPSCATCGQASTGCTSCRPR
jgi:putative FmdB family regulatory protein